MDVCLEDLTFRHRFMIPTKGIVAFLHGFIAWAILWGVSVSDRSTHFTSEQQPLQPNLPTHTHTHTLPSSQATLHCLQLMRATACAVDARRAALPSLISALCHVSTLSR